MNQKPSSTCPIFIVGMPRSGTTLMSALLSAHPHITISPESHFIRHWLKPYSEVDLNNPDCFDRFWKEFSSSERFSHFGVDAQVLRDRVLQLEAIDLQGIFTSLLEEYAIARNKSRWGEKTPDHYRYIDVLLSWYPQARVIWIVRDPRAVVASLMRVPWAGSSVQGHAFTWRSSMQKLQAWRSDARVKVVQYEALVDNTESVLRQLCEFLGEPYTPTMLNRSETDAPIVNREGWAKGHLQKSLQPIDKSSLDKWKSELTPHQIAAIDFITKQELLQSGYRLSSQKLPLNRQLEILIHRATSKVGMKSSAQL